MGDGGKGILKMRIGGSRATSIAWRNMLPFLHDSLGKNRRQGLCFISRLEKCTWFQNSLLQVFFSLALMTRKLCDISLPNANLILTILHPERAAVHPRFSHYVHIYLCLQIMRHVAADRDRRVLAGRTDGPSDVYNNPHDAYPQGDKLPESYRINDCAK